MADFLDDTRKEITEKLKALKPAVDEYSRLEAAAAALRGVAGAASSGTAAPRRRGPGRPRGSANRKPAASAAAAKPARKKAGRPPGRKKAGRPGRRKGTGTRAAEALTFVQGQPGITIPELAAKVGIKQNYLYRVLPGLEKDGKVQKKGRGWVAK